MGEIPYTIQTALEKIVADYANCTIMATQELDVFTFYALAHDGFVCNKRQTEEGRKYLRNAWRLTQTEPDVAGLQKRFGERK